MTDRKLSIRELNRTLLARQLLLARSSDSVDRVLRRLVALQSQVPQSPHLALWSRVAAYTPDSLNSLAKDRRVVRATAMRATLHTLLSEDYLRFRAALQPAMSKALRGFFSSSWKEMDLESIRLLGEEFMAVPHTFAELKAHFGQHPLSCSPEAATYAARTHLPLVQIPEDKLWGYSNNPKYVLASEWLGRSPQEDDGALASLARRYLQAYGPASRQDLEYWTGMTGMRGVLEKLRPELVEYVDKSGKKLMDLEEAEILPGDVPAPLRLLPEWDSALLGHVDRSRILPESYRKAIVRTVGRIMPSVLVDGFVAGTWQITASSKRVRLEVTLFAPVPEGTHLELEAEAWRLLQDLYPEARHTEVLIKRG